MSTTTDSNTNAKHTFGGHRNQPGKPIRRPHDEYPTPYSLTRLLLKAEKFNKAKSLLEPHSGNDGAILRVLAEANFKCVENGDIQFGQDFLTRTERVEQIIMNPPFTNSTAHIIHARRIARQKVAALLPIDYLSGKARHKIYNETAMPLARVHIMTFGVDFSAPLREDGMFEKGSMTVAWFVWEADHYGRPEINFLDNTPFCVRSDCREQCDDDEADGVQPVVPIVAPVSAVRKAARARSGVLKVTTPVIVPALSGDLPTAIIKAFGKRQRTHGQIVKEIGLENFGITRNAVLYHIRKLTSAGALSKLDTKPASWKVAA